jgi:FAD:protein FMN transferase
MTGVREWELWTTQCRLVVTDPTTLPEAVELTDALLAGVERACSRFHGDSELLNLKAGWNDLSPMLADLVRAALVAAWLSDGSVDPTLGAALTELGYDRDLADVPDQGGLRRVLGSPGWRSLQLDGNRLYRPADVHLDLGATAKAVAADRCAAAISEKLGTGVLVSLGGDIATAGRAPGSGWQVTVQDLPTDAPQQVTLAAGAAIATSSTAKRTWLRDGRRLHHLIDPATGMPAESPWRAVTVVSYDCALANTATTGAIIKGHDAVSWLRTLGLPSRLVDRAGAVHTVNAFPRAVAA